MNELSPDIEWLLVPEDHTEQSFLCQGFDPDGPKGGFIIQEAISRDDLPDWIKDRLDVLSVIGVGAEVPGVGRRTDFSYWIWGDEYENKSED